MLCLGLGRAGVTQHASGRLIFQATAVVCAVGLVKRNPNYRLIAICPSTEPHKNWSIARTAGPTPGAELGEGFARTGARVG